MDDLQVCFYLKGTQIVDVTEEQCLEHFGFSKSVILEQIVTLNNLLVSLPSDLSFALFRHVKSQVLIQASLSAGPKNESCHYPLSYFQLEMALKKTNGSNLTLPPFLNFEENPNSEWTLCARPIRPSEMTLLIDKKCVVLSCSGDTKAVTGMEPIDILGNRFFELLVPPPYDKFHSHYIDLVLKNESSPKVVGHTRYLPNVSGGEICLQATMHKENDIRYFRAQVTKLDSSLEVCLELNKDGEIMRGSELIEYMSGYTISELINKQLNFFVASSKSKSSILENFSRPLLEDVGIPIQRTVRHKDGSFVPVEVTLYLIKTDQVTYLAHLKYRQLPARTKATQVVDSQQAQGVKYYLRNSIAASLCSSSYRATNSKTGEEVRVCFFEKNALKDQDYDAVQKALNMQAKIKHPNIMPISELIPGPRNLTVVTDYVELTLSTYMQRNSPMPEGQAKIIASQLLQAAVFCHHKDFLHGPFYPEYIFLKSLDEIKLSDFVYRALNESRISIGDPPEGLFGGKFLSPKSDMWNLGVIIYEMICGVNPFTSVSESLNPALEFPDWVSPDAKDLLQKLLHLNPANRPSPQEFSDHPWLQVVESPLQRVKKSKQELPLKN